MLLGLNIDHVATLREARYRDSRGSELAEPDLIEAARAVVAGGADSITVHTRVDGRHMQTADAYAIQRELPDVPLNLEMGLTQDMLDFARDLAPAYACLVPEGREEVTTEGGLDLACTPKAVEQAVERLQAQGTRVSLFIDPDLDQVKRAVDSGAEMIELHTGAYANAQGQDARQEELDRLVAAAQLAHDLELQVNAGHGLRLDNLEALGVVPHLAELNIGHSTICRALFIGLEAAVRELREAIEAVDWA